MVVKSFIAAWVVFVAVRLVCADSQIVPTLQASRFSSPPATAKPSCYWWWFNDLVNKDGITRDLEEFKAKGLGGVMIVCTANGYGVGPMPNGPKFLSPQWRELYRHALKEADRLNLEVGVNLCGGWCMGGPWITPENASRWFLQAQFTLTGPQKFSGVLPLPGPRDGYDSPPEGGVGVYINLPLEKVDYRDTAVVAFREPEGNASKLDAARRQSLPAKSNRLDANCYAAARNVMEQTLVPWAALPGDKPIAVQDVVDLTEKVKPGGHLDWDVPAGKWTIVRTGHRMTGQPVNMAMPESDGWAVDWLSPAATEQHFEHLGKILLDEAGPLAGKTLKFFGTDSFEDGYPNWTGKMLRRFKEYRGYDATPYLPVFTGRIVGSAEISDRFLYDYRKTVADCMADGNYRRFAELSHQQGLAIDCEAAGPCWSGTMCLDALKNLGRCDMPQGEFWQDGTFVVNEQNKVGKQTATAAHVYGHKTASAEAFTGFNHWRESPATLKPTADRAFCEGINRFVFHTMTATRPQDGQPGYEYGAGTHFNPNVTWWNHGAEAWLDYVGRCQYLLQEGQFVADVLYYNGDGAPNLVEPKHADPSLGTGYDYDVCNTEVLLTRLAVKDGRIVLPDGMTYRLLALPDRKTMPVEVLNKIKALVEAGATVVGPRPESDPGLKDYPHSDDVVRQTAAELWGRLDEKNIDERKVGRGRIIWGTPLRHVLLTDGIGPDFEYDAAESLPSLEKAAWIWHAQDGDNPPAATRLFKSEVEIPAGQKVQSARLCMTADNGFELHVNGQLACSGDKWTRVYEMDLRALLRPGNNTLEVSAINTEPGPAGLIARLVVQCERGAPIVLTTDGSWVSSTNGQSWTRARMLGMYGCLPWGRNGSDNAAPLLDFIHRTNGSSDVYFLANRKDHRTAATCTFRAGGRQPELWDPVRGTTRDLPQFTQKDGRTTIPLEFDQYESMFIVFSKPIAAGASTSTAMNFPSLMTTREVTGPWTVKFDPTWGGPQQLILAQLEDWTKRSEEGVRHYSGTATYEKVFNWADGSPSQRVFLDLGTVKEIAAVRLNGKSLGVVWCAPWRVDISEALKAGENHLEIDVTNLWPNRLIGDASLPQNLRRTRTNVGFTPDQPLLSSGLLGPVTIGITVERIDRLRQ